MGSPENLFKPLRTIKLTKFFNIYFWILQFTYPTVSGTLRKIRQTKGWVSTLAMDLLLGLNTDMIHHWKVNMWATLQRSSKHTLVRQTQNRQNANLFLQSSELGLPQTLTRRRECPPPLVPGGGGGAHSLAREGVGESQFRRWDIHCGTLYIYVLCAAKTTTKFSIIYLSWVLCLSVCDCVCECVCHNCGTHCYSFSFNNQTDQGDETEGLQMEGLEMERYKMERLKREGVNRVFIVYA
jgi:hypothetical protein